MRVWDDFCWDGRTGGRRRKEGADTALKTKPHTSIWGKTGVPATASLHRRLQPFFTEKHKVSCSGFLPNTSPMQHSCSHENAICSHRFHKRIELRTHDDTRSAEHHGGAKKHQNERARNRLTQELPFLAACSHFTVKNARFRSPSQGPCSIHAAITMRSATSDTTSE